MAQVKSLRRELRGKRLEEEFTSTAEPPRCYGNDFPIVRRAS